MLTLISQLAEVASQAPLTWSVPPLSAATVLVLLRPNWRPAPYLAKVFLLSGAVLSVVALFSVVPAYWAIGLALLALASLVLDELLRQLPVVFAILARVRVAGTPALPQPTNRR